MTSNSAVPVTDQRPGPPAPSPAPPVTWAAWAPVGTDPFSRLARARLRLVQPYVYRHPKAFGAVYLVTGTWWVAIGTYLCTIGWWVGIALIVAAPVELFVAFRLLLGVPSLERVRQLERSRARAVDDSAARLRRIERDLHDGAQAQMVAVAMKLGLAREKLVAAVDGTGQADLERILDLVTTAHRGAKEAITELRDLARGIHPAVLDDGLGTALRTLAASSSVPVDLAIDLPQRPSAAIETIAYFCAAELLTNVSKHSGAQRATLEVVHMPGMVRILVTDDGAGGARIEGRGGLAGLAERAGIVDGALQLSSPPGGPTVIAVELPSHA
jgi:signal transduction histidine kinase